MDEKTKMMFKVHIKILEARMTKPETKELHSYAAYAMEELISLYSGIMGISYDEAVEVLHKEDE